MTNERDMLDAGLGILREYGVPAELEEREPDAKWAIYYRPDARIRLKIGTRYQDFDVQCKKWLKPGNLGPVAAQIREAGNRVILFTDHATGPMADRLRKLGIPFVDMAGNAWLEVPPVVLRVEGRKPIEQGKAPPRNRAFQPTGLQVVFALLCRPELFKAPLREVAEVTGVAHGTVGWVMHGLRERGYLIERGEGRGRKRTPRNLLRLLDEWTAEYTRVLRPALIQGRYAPGPNTKPRWWADEEIHKHGILLGGETAAEQLTDYLQAGTITMYTERLPGRLVVEQRLAKDDRGTIEFRRRFWPFQHDWEHPELVPPVLIHADLLATDEARCVETARMIHEQYLAGPLGQY